MLKIRDLHVEIEGKQILKGVDLEVKSGEIHAVMGPNGSGKSTLANVLAGNPAYEVNGGEVEMEGDNLLRLSPDQRSAKGLFLAFQYPIEVPGVSVERFLREAYRIRCAEIKGKEFSALEFRRHLESLADELEVDPALIKRGLNEGFSGGEKKRLEILQMAVLRPRFAILDETDSGLDIDAIKAVAAGVKKIIQKYNTGVIVITHYKRILEYLQPDFVHVMKQGKIIRSGGKSLVEELEKSGYKSI